MYQVRLTCSNYFYCRSSLEILT